MNMFYQLKKYIQFFTISTTKHGVHSPFVFDLVTKCFNKKTSKKSFEIINRYKSELNNNNTEITVTDFGAGSRVFKTNKRIVSEVLKNVSISNKQALLLTRLVSYFKSEAILEIGTSLGVGTLSLALGNKNAIITTLEGCSETIKITKNILGKYISNKIIFKEGEFDKTLTEVTLGKKYDIVYFDGNHQKEPTIRYFKQCLKTVHNETLFIFDDIYWSKEMTEAWKYIKNHKKVTLTIDTFHLGFVFFRKEQFQKEHFTIRI